MKGSKLLAIVLVIALAVSLVLTGCGSQSTAEKVNITGPQKVTINLGTEPPQMNSILTTDVTSMNVMRATNEGLTRLDPGSKPMPGIAEKWDISSDKLTYTFHLRDAKWSDGTPVTAKDFEFAWKTILNKDTAAEYAYMLYVIKNGQAYNEGKAKAEDVGVKATDDKTLVVTLERYIPYFLDICAFGVLLPVKEEFYNKNISGDKNTNGTEFDKMLYNGPFVMKSWAHEDRIVLEKNPNYWNAKDIHLEEVTMLMVKDTNTALNMFNGNEADMIGLKGDQVEPVKNAGYEPAIYQDGATFYFEYNLKDPVMKNNNIRKALTYAVDRQTLIKNVFKDSSLPALSFTNPVIKGEKDNFKKEVGDIIKDNNSDEAKKLLQQGMQELGLTSIPKISILTDDTDIAKRDGAAYQEFWKKNLGLDVEVQSMPFKSRLARMTAKDFQIVVAGWGPDYNDPMTFLDMFETGNGNNHTSYSDQAYDDMLNKARNELDNTKRYALLKDMETKLMNDLPIGPVYFRSRNYVCQPWFKGIVRDAFQDINLYWAYVDNSKKK